MKKKNIMIFILVFIIPICIIWTHLLSMELFTGHYFKRFENFLIADMSAQYNSIYAYIWDVLRGNQSIFYSFGKSLGGNMFSTIGYYAASPLNVLYLFCSKANIPMMTFIIYCIKIGLSSLFMYIFLNQKLNEKKYNIIFSIIYALMAYNVNYYFNNMWLDVIALTPLVLLGIDKLISSKSIWFYCLFLGLAILSNYYISYMLCIFCVIYFIYSLLLNYKLHDFKKYKSIVLRFVIASLIGGALSMFFVLPSVANLSEIMRFSVNKNRMYVYLSDFINLLCNNVLSKLYIGSHDISSVLSRKNPNIYSGLLSVILTFFFFFNHNIKRKEKIMSFIVLMFFIISFETPILNLFWQAGSYPNGYVCRYSFLFSFYIIYLSARCFHHLSKIKLRYFLIFILLYAAISIRLTHQYILFMDYSDIIITSIFIIIYLIILGIMMYFKRTKKIMIVILFLVVIVELFVNFKLCFITNDDLNQVNGYKDYYDNVCSAFNSLEGDFYRIDGDYNYSCLDSWICNNYMIKTSLSTNSGHLYKFWKDNGGSVTYTTINYDKNKLPIFDALFGVKYIHSSSLMDGTYYELYDTIPRGHLKEVKKEKKKKNNYKYLYKNPYALSLGFLIPNDYKKTYKKYPVKDSVDSLNRMMRTLSGVEEDVLFKYKTQMVGPGKYQTVIDNDVDYFYITLKYDVSINWQVYDSIYINEKYIVSSTSSDLGHIKIKNKYPHSTIKTRIGTEKSPNIASGLVVFYLDLNHFKKMINELNNHQMTNVKINGNKVTGQIKVDKSSVLFTSIPYEKGWKVYVDGKATNYEKVIDEFIGIRLSKGKHNIKMIYYPHHLKLGILISIISLISLIFYEILIRINNNK